MATGNTHVSDCRGNVVASSNQLPFTQAQTCPGRGASDDFERDGFADDGSGRSLAARAASTPHHPKRYGRRRDYRSSTTADERENGRSAHSDGFAGCVLRAGEVHHCQRDLVCAVLRVAMLNADTRRLVAVAEVPAVGVRNARGNSRASARRTRVSCRRLSRRSGRVGCGARR